jgi:hypothetical protein
VRYVTLNDRSSSEFAGFQRLGKVEAITDVQRFWSGGTEKLPVRIDDRSFVKSLNICNYRFQITNRIRLCYQYSGEISPMPSIADGHYQLFGSVRLM